MHKLLAAVVIALPLSVAMAGECKTGNGATCTATCKVGTLSLSCGQSSCSSSCSDSSGNRIGHAADLYRDMIVASEGRIDRQSLRTFFSQRQFNRSNPNTTVSIGSTRLAIQFQPALVDGLSPADVERMLSDLERKSLNELSAPSFRYPP